MAGRMNATVAGFQLAIPAGHIPGAINLPRDRWHTLDGLRKDQTNVLYCYSQVCHLAATAAVEFSTKGYPIMELEGRWRWLKEDGFPTSA